VSWEAVIGLEVHVQLGTRSKIFCGCPNRFGDGPNTNVCPVCTGQPGVLPVLNAEAVALAVRTALALDCTVHARSVFARKQYFYPDLPKGYQISQYEEPYAEHGALTVEVDGQARRFGITRIHMEEDAGKSVHGGPHEPYSLLDFNRAGSPLVEIVSEPDLRSPADAGAYLRELHAIIRALGVSDADMEKGNFRCDANVSVRPSGQAELGTKAEVKNLNSFRYVEKAIAWEIERQIAVIEGGGRVVQETRLWDADAGRTVSMRSKEEAHDYRYFPDPDLPPLVLDEDAIAAARAALPELPAARRARYVATYSLTQADAAQIAADPTLVAYFEETVAAGAEARQAANWLLNEVLRHADGERLPVAAVRLAALLALIADGSVPGNVARRVFEHMLTSDDDPQTIIAREGLAPVADAGELGAIIDGILAQHPAEVQRWRDGDRKLQGFFMGQIMKATGGKASAEVARTLLSEKLG
jgi:aspartyl-tRNA(Asn)/glutamyl-tRNA(Gln) amidotransferase subunit B